MRTSCHDSAVPEHVAIDFQLPPELLVQLLEKLDQQQLGIASLVCTCWRDASLIVLKRLNLELRLHSRPELLPYWLRSRAQHLQHLKLEDFLVVPMELGTAAQLSSLELRNGVLTSSSSHTLPSLKHSLTALAIGDVAADVQLFSSIAALTNLLNLSYVRVDWRALPPRSMKSASEAASSIWSNLQQLTSLSVVDCGLDDQFVQHISRLSNLQQLDLSMNRISDVRVLLPLPCSLTYLSLDGNNQNLDCCGIISEHPPWQLQHLSISGLSMSDPGQLSSLTRLTYLSACMLNTPNNAQLLAVLPRLQHLQHLELYNTFQTVSDIEQRAVLQDLNAALQLPQLTHLDFSHNVVAVQAMDPQADPLGAPVLFSKSNIPRLQVLLLDGLWNRPQDGLRRYKIQCFRVLVNKCPRLQQLNVRGSVHKDCRCEDLQPLQQLSCLTKLSIGGGEPEVFDLSGDVLKLLATLTTLEHLVLHGSPKMTDLGLMSLTKLTRLTELEVQAIDEAAVSPQLAIGARHNYLMQTTLVIESNKDPVFLHKPRSVWQQLSELCAQSPVCWGEKERRLKELERELRAAKEEYAADILSERKQTAAAKDEAVVAKKEAAAAKREAAVLRQQLSELRAANAAK